MRNIENYFMVIVFFHIIYFFNLKVQKFAGPLKSKGIPETENINFFVSAIWESHTGLKYVAYSRALERPLGVAVFDKVSSADSRVVWSNFFFRFLEELKIPKILFKINQLLPLNEAASLNILLSTLQLFTDPASKLIIKKNRFHKIANTEYRLKFILKIT